MRIENEFKFSDFMYSEVMKEENRIVSIVCWDSSSKKEKQIECVLSRSSDRIRSILVCHGLEGDVE